MKNSRSQIRLQNPQLRKALTNHNELPNKEKMITEEITPPPHVWDKIEQALNLQQQRYKTANDIIMTSFTKKGQNQTNFH